MYKNIISMVIKKIILGGFILFVLNGCAQSTAFLGPLYTLGTTGNVVQTGLSYGSNKAMKKINKKNKEKNLEKKNNFELKQFLKVRISETRKKLKVIK